MPSQKIFAPLLLPEQVPAGENGIPFSLVPVTCEART